MYRSYLAAAWRSARRDWFHAVLNVVGLALGFAAAILIGLFVRDELTYNRFLPGQEDIYRAQFTITEPGQRSTTSASMPSQIAGELKLDFPEIVQTARYVHQYSAMRHGDVEANEYIEAVDPNYLDVIRGPMLRGDPATALAEPDTVVLVRSLAIKYFGTIDCVGQILELDHVPMRVTGVLEEAPSNMTDPYTGLVAGRSASSRLAALDAVPPVPGSLNTTLRTYVQLPHGMDPARLAERFPAFVEAHYPNLQGGKPIVALFLNPLSNTHLHPSNPDSSEVDDGVQTLYAAAATGLIILLLAGINFVNLLTARATRRALEVGVRKTYGGLRRQLVMQFMGEALAYSLAGMVPGIALAAFCLPSLNAFLGRQIAFDYWHDPLLATAPVAAAILFGLAAGLYPAVIMSRFAPALVLKARSGGSIGGSGLRRVLVVLQFTVTIALLIAAVVIYRQIDFATSQALRFDKDLRLIVELTGTPWQSSADGLGRRDVAPVELLRTRLARVAGVEGIAGSYTMAATNEFFSLDFHRPGQTSGPPIELFMLPIDFDYFGLYGIPIVAGRDFSRDFADDQAAAEGTDAANDTSRLTAAIINETAARELGYANASAAIGQPLESSDPAFPNNRHRIVGVVPDFPMNSIHDPVQPTAFFINPVLFNVLTLKLSGADLKQTLRDINTVWHELEPDHPIYRYFLDARIATLYVKEVREGRLLAAFAGIAGAIGCLGLIGLSAYTAERRTKEIGIRKTQGASTFDIAKLMIWEFAKPVLLANLLAWPIAWWFVRRWLDGYAYRIDLNATPFLAVGLVAVAIAVATTAFHAIQVARSRPVVALRYE
jgi:putative ABC transport system permease protein